MSADERSEPARWPWWTGPLALLLVLVLMDIGVTLEKIREGCH